MSPDTSQPQSGHVLLVVPRDDDGRLLYSLRCLDAHLGAERPCAALYECSEHPWPEDDDETWGDIKGPDDTPPDRWVAYQSACAEYEDAHPVIGWHRSDECWAEMRLLDAPYGPGDGWSFEDGFDPGPGEHHVTEDNVGHGGPEDAELVIGPPR